MAGGMDIGAGGKGGKKPLDTAINLIPFIDLMAVTIVFLIISAVWTQLGRLQVSQAGQSPDPQPQELPTLQPVTMLISEKELRLTVGGSQLDPIPIVLIQEGKTKGSMDTGKLLEKLKELKGQQPEQSTITLMPEDGVKYDVLVRVIDTCIGGDFPSVAVSAATP